MNPPPVGVVVMAYGTPASPADIEPYYTHIRRGRPPTPEQLSNLVARYEALGGTSTLAARTVDQVKELTDALSALAPGRFTVAQGNKHAAPFIEDAVTDLIGRGVQQVVGVVLAPHYSGFSVGEYQKRVVAAAGSSVDVKAIERWHDLAAYRTFLGASVRDALVVLPERTEVVFTAHSLPERVLNGDPYPAELEESAAATAELVGLRRRADGPGPDGGNGARWSVGWQSAGATPEPWRGPDILEVVADRGASGEVDAVLVCPHGFVADHLEVAYDLDIETLAAADRAGIGFARTAVLNSDPSVLGALAQRIAQVAS